MSCKGIVFLKESSDLLEPHSGGWVGSFGGERLKLSTKVFDTIKSLITVLKMLTHIQKKLTPS